MGKADLSPLCDLSAKIIWHGAKGMKMSSSQSVYRAPAFADFKPELSAPGATPERLAHLEEHGFCHYQRFCR